MFIDRQDAGQQLGAALRRHELDRPLMVLGLPRGGVPVAAVVADMLDAPLDVCVVRKLGVPGHEELGFGAIASGGAVVLNPDIVSALKISRGTIDIVLRAERRELERRERAFRDGLPFPVLIGETVILVDDGAATGASMHAAVLALRQLGPREIIVAVPVASRDAMHLLRSVADDCVSIIQPEPFYGVGAWYEEFQQTSDDEVRGLLARGRRRWDTRAPLHIGTRAEP
jgi:predicted phosphoribosyltransferase